MLKTFTKEYMQQNCGCYGIEKMESIFFFIGNTDISIDCILKSEIPLKDKYWFICKKTGLTTEQNRQIAIDIAELVLPIFEKRYPEDIRPRKAIEAVKQFISGHISISLLIEKRSAAAAAAAYDAAAYDAAYAAAAAAADVAYAADDAADDDIKEQLFQYLINFVKNP